MYRRSGESGEKKMGTGKGGREGKKKRRQEKGSVS